MGHDGPTFVYVGNRRKGPSSWAPPSDTALGIGLFTLDPTTGSLTFVRSFVEDISVGALSYDAGRGVLYALHESLTLPGWPRGGGGLICSFAVDPETGDLNEICRQASFGTLPAYAALDSTGELLTVVHHTGHTPITRTARCSDGSFKIELAYDDATTVLFPLGPLGEVGEPLDVVTHEGHGTLPAQTHPQLHCIARAPGTDWFVVCDKGADRLRILEIDRKTMSLVERATLSTPPGSSPRYCVFHPKLPIFYVNFETANLIQAYHFASNGLITLSQETKALPDDESSSLMQSDLLMHPKAGNLYTLIRGQEAVSVFSLDPHSGRLTHQQQKSLDAENVRGAAISANGRFFLSAAVVSQSVKVWALNADGHLEGVVSKHAQPAPGCFALV